ncbi:uncharacterized protein YqeY [Xanthomonas sacchari]|uniref:hypothetical protein n=1 Tax=Xanthomonas sacchari TaxID=56458 RepID=UPI002783A5C3|nr:hypothetical protein [Xanthomonas sacchari]MDQ1092876.1 uncharacterized protein YqeY [Xanthomonas sacchari]
MSTDAAARLVARLKSDLTAALRARNAAEIAVLRQLIAAIDDAQAVAVGDRHDRYRVHAFGDPAVEVPRRSLDDAALRALLEREIHARGAAATTYRRLAQDERAQALDDAVRVLRRYLPPAH